MTAVKPCSFDGCTNLADSATLCRGHYQQKYRGQELRPLKPHRRITDDPPTCTAPDCDRVARSKGLCVTHYRRLRADIPLDLPINYRTMTDGDGQISRSRRMTPEEKGCKFPDCDRPHSSHGYCKSHARQHRNGWELKPIGTTPPGRPKGKRVCDYPDCGRPHRAKGWCVTHLKQHQRGEEMRPVQAQRQGCITEGCRQPHYGRGWCRSCYDTNMRGRKPRRKAAPRTPKPKAAPEASNLPAGWFDAAKPKLKRTQKQARGGSLEPEGLGPVAENSPEEEADCLRLLARHDALDLADMLGLTRQEIAA